MCANLSEETSGEYNVMLHHGVWTAQRYVNAEPEGAPHRRMEVADPLAARRERPLQPLGSQSPRHDRTCSGGVMTASASGVASSLSRPSLASRLRSELGAASSLSRPSR